MQQKSKYPKEFNNDKTFQNNKIITLFSVKALTNQNDYIV